MTKKALYSLTHDADGQPVSWIIGTAKDNGQRKKPDLVVWAKGYTVEKLLQFAEYLKGTTCFDSFLLIEAKTGNVCQLAAYMAYVEAKRGQTA